MAGTLNFLPASEPQNARIKVIGVGGAGGNAVDRMICNGLNSVEFIAVNTDAQALDRTRAGIKIQIGKQLTKGLGSGGNPDIGRQAAEQDADQLKEVMQDSDLIFITAGMGGGTGTGAAPKVAQLARELGALTVAIVTKPFDFEGRRRASTAEGGIKELREKVDTLIGIPNQRLVSVVDERTSLLKAFELADSVLSQATRGISDLITVPGIINLDFADVRTIMEGMGDALIGIGVAVGEDRGTKAAMQAISSPLLEDVKITGAQGVLVNITGSSEITLHEVNQAVSLINDAAGDRANVIFGAVVDDNLGEEIRVTLIATGFNHRESKVAPFPKLEQSVDFRSAKKPVDIEIPTVIRREGESKDGNGNGNGNRKHLGEIDLESEPPDISLPTFLRRNGGR
jgi:cell division protein FtsZ